MKEVKKWKHKKADIIMIAECRNGWKGKESWLNQNFNNISNISIEWWMNERAYACQGMLTLSIFGCVVLFHFEMEEEEENNQIGSSFNVSVTVF